MKGEGLHPPPPPTAPETQLAWGPPPPPTNRPPETRFLPPDVRQLVVAMGEKLCSRPGFMHEAFRKLDANGDGSAGGPGDPRDPHAPLPRVYRSPIPLVCRPPHPPYAVFAASTPSAVLLLIFFRQVLLLLLRPQPEKVADRRGQQEQELSSLPEPRHDQEPTHHLPTDQPLPSLLPRLPPPLPPFPFPPHPRS